MFTSTMRSVPEGTRSEDGVTDAACDRQARAGAFRVEASTRFISTILFGSDAVRCSICGHQRLLETTEG